MNGLIGAADSAKFIFVAVDDDSELPSKSVMNNYFPLNKMSIYKSWGHFSYSFRNIETYFNIKTNGISSYDPWRGGGNRCITHAIRLSNTCPTNSFFGLHYGHIVVGYFHLSQDLMKELEDLLSQLREVNNLCGSMDHCRSQLINGISFGEKNELPDFKMRQPSAKAIGDLFDNYGDAAKQELLKRLMDWNSRSIWS